MKTRYYFIILIQFVFLTISAQRFRAGFSIGGTVTDIDGADTRDNDNDFHKPGLTAGGIISMSLTPLTSFQFELNYVQKGSSQPPDSNNAGYYKIALDYLEIPFLLRRRVPFNFRKKRVNRFDIEGGVSVGRMVRRYVTGSTISGLVSQDKYYNKTDVSLFAGIDYNFTKNVYFCFRYCNSVIPAIKRNTPNINFITYTFNRGNNLVFQFSFKFLFDAVGANKTKGVKVEE